MTRYALHADLSFCRSGDRLVFLDIAGDRYFSLPTPMERTLSAYLQGDECADHDLRALTERGILVDVATAGDINRAHIRSARRSAMEAPASDVRLRLRDLAEVLVLVVRARLELKFSSLKRILDDIATRASDEASQTRSDPASSEAQIAAAAAVFRRARLFVPVETRCLLDSIAMARFLRRRDLHARIVFGVAFDPFTAHCWVQTGDLVLNDTAGNVASHTPIRVV